MRTARVSIATVLVAMLAACGGGTATSTPTSTSEPATTSTSTTVAFGSPLATTSTTSTTVPTLGAEITRGTAVLATACLDSWWTLKHGLDTRYKDNIWPRGVAQTVKDKCDAANTSLSIDAVGVPTGDYPMRTLAVVMSEIAFKLAFIELDCRTPTCAVKQDALDLLAFGAPAFKNGGKSLGGAGLGDIPGLRVKG